MRKTNEPLKEQTSLSALLRLPKTLNLKGLKQKTIQKDKEEAELKQQILSTLLSEEKPIEGFKKYLELLIVKNTGKKSTEFQINTEECAKNLINDICKDSATIKMEERLKSRLKHISSLKDQKDKIDEELDEMDLEDEKMLEEIRLKNNKIIHTSKKLKNRMKLERVDKEKLFNLRTMKHFNNLDTFINAKEFIEQINPLNNKKEITESSKLRSMRLLSSIKKFQKEISSFFDEKIHDFIKRVEENEQENLIKNEEAKKKLKQEEESNSQNSSSCDSDRSDIINTKENQYFKTLYSKIIDKKNPNETNSPHLQKKATAENNSFLQKFQKKKSLFKYLNRNSLFIQHNITQNPEFAKVFREIYNPSGLLKKSKRIVNDNQVRNNQIMNHLIVTDPSLNQMDFEIENQSTPVIDEFFNKTMNHFSRQDYNQKGAIINLETSDGKSSIRNLENLVHEILNKQGNKKKQNEDIAWKYKEFKNKASNILKLINKTSKQIFNEKNKNFSDKKLSLIQDIKNKVKVSEQRRKAITIDSANIFLLTNRSRPSNEMNETLKKTSIMTTSNKFETKQQDFFFNNEKETLKKKLSEQPQHLQIKHSKTVSFPTLKDELSPILSPLSKLEIPKLRTKKFFINKLNQIVNQTEVVKQKYESEHANLKKIELESTTFFNEQKGKLKPRLESLMFFDPVKIKKYHRRVKSFYKEKVKKEKQKQIASNGFTVDY